MNNKVQSLPGGAPAESAESLWDLIVPLHVRSIRFTCFWKLTTQSTESFYTLDIRLVAASESRRISVVLSLFASSALSKPYLG